VVVIEGLLLLLALLLLVPALTFTLQVWLARPAAPEPLDPAAAPRPRSVVLIPAHDEAGGIVGTLQSVMPQLAEGDVVLVVADNCSDDTAERARAAGAMVIERRNLVERGKGYALDHGIRWLEQQATPPGVVIFIDADCSVTPGSIDRLARETQMRARPVQALDLMHAPRGASLQARVAEFAWLVRNQVRPLGMRALGLPCHLMGTGMAMPWELIRGAHLASGHLAEDMELGLSLAQAGHTPHFCPQASVHSFFPLQAASSQAQRRRWEHGHLSMIATRGLPLLGRALRRADRALLGTALDTCVPPLASLVVAQSGLLGLTAGFWLATGRGWPLALAALGLAGVGLAVMRAWRGFGREVLEARELAGVPAYILAKLPIYLEALLGRRASWQRARRDGDEPAPDKADGPAIKP
jgi:Glycosyltransferase like family 2